MVDAALNSKGSLFCRININWRS